MVGVAREAMRSGVLSLGSPGERRRGFWCGPHRRRPVRSGPPCEGPSRARPRYRAVVTRAEGCGRVWGGAARLAVADLAAMTDTDRVVLITGASGALGRETARVFAADGHRLGLVGTDRDRLAGVARDLGLAEDRWVAGVGDLRQRDGARAAVGA